MLFRRTYPNKKTVKHQGHKIEIEDDLAVCRAEFVVCDFGLPLQMEFSRRSPRDQADHVLNQNQRQTQHDRHPKTANSVVTSAVRASNLLRIEMFAHKYILDEFLRSHFL